jgi:hypothetical protein
MQRTDKQGQTKAAAALASIRRSASKRSLPPPPPQATLQQQQPEVKKARVWQPKLHESSRSNKKKTATLVEAKPIASAARSHGAACSLASSSAACPACEAMASGQSAKTAK